MTLVGQGAVAVSDDPREVFTATLGSCVAITMHDPDAHVGGMTHTVSPEGCVNVAGPLHDYERVFNGMMKAGARKDRLVVAVMGGAHVIRGRRAVGTDLSQAILDILRAERVAPARVDVGGAAARRIRFEPVTGTLGIAEVPEMDLCSLRAPLRRAVDPDAVELF